MWGVVFTACVIFFFKAKARAYTHVDNTYLVNKKYHFRGRDTHACTSACTSYTHIHIHTHTNAHTQMHTHTCMHTHTHLHNTNGPEAQAHACTNASIYNIVELSIYECALLFVYWKAYIHLPTRTHASNYEAAQPLHVARAGIIVASALRTFSSHTTLFFGS